MDKKNPANSIHDAICRALNNRRNGGSDLGAFHEFARARIDADIFTFFEIERDKDCRACLERRRLRAALSRIAFHAGVRFDDLEDDERRELNRNGLAAMEEHLDFDIVLQERHGIRDEVFLDVDLLVIALIHEHVFIFFLIEILHLADLKVRLANGIAGTEVVLKDTAGNQALVLRLDEGNAFAGFDMLTFDDHIRFAVDLDLKVFAKILS